MKQQPPAREPWDDICRDIAAAFKYVRESWFKTCVSAARQAEAPVVNSHLGGQADIAITAYQLYLVTAVLNDREYIPREQGSKFVSLVWDHICGPDHSPYQALWGRIVGLEIDRPAQMLALSRPVAEYISGQQDVKLLAVVLGALSEQLTVLSQAVMAETFGDTEMLNKVREHVQSKTDPPTRARTSDSGCAGLLIVALTGLTGLLAML